MSNMRADGTRTRARSRTCPALSLPESPVLAAVARPGAGPYAQHAAVAVADGVRPRARTDRPCAEPARPPHCRHQHPPVPARTDGRGARGPGPRPFRVAGLRVARNRAGLVGEPATPR